MQKQMSAMEAILTRQSIRAFTDAPVSEEQVRSIVRAGMFAPSAHNKRSWRMITITRRATLDALSGLSRYWYMLKEATLCIATCAYTTDVTEENAEYLAQNGAAATQNMLLAAHAQGLGACWLGVNPLRAHHQPAKDVLGVPDEVRLVSLIAIGHVRGELPARSAPVERMEENKWHREGWNENKLSG